MPEVRRLPGLGALHHLVSSIRGENARRVFELPGG